MRAWHGATIREQGPVVSPALRALRAPLIRGDLGGLKMRYKMRSFALRNCRKLLKSLVISPPPPPPALRHNRSQAIKCFASLLSKADRTVLNPLSPPTKGFSIVGVLVASGIMSILIMGSMGFMANQLKEQQKMVERGTIQSLKNEMGILLDSEKNCRTSLAGDGAYSSPSTPVKFKKSAINDSTEGLEVELYTSSQDGKSRGAKMFSATDSKFKFYGSLEIRSIKLFMDTEGPDDYLESTEHEDIGTLRVTVKGLEKETSFDIRLSVWMKTDADNNTTLLSCSKSSSSAPRCGDKQKWHPKCGCALKTLLSSPFFHHDTCNYGDILKREEQFWHGTCLGKWDFCALSHIHIKTRRRRHTHECGLLFINGLWSGHIDPPNYSSKKGTKCHAICIKLQYEGEPRDSCPSAPVYNYSPSGGSSTGGGYGRGRSSSGGGSSWGGGGTDGGDYGGGPDSPNAPAPPDMPPDPSFDWSGGSATAGVWGGGSSSSGSSSGGGDDTGAW